MYLSPRQIDFSDLDMRIIIFGDHSHPCLKKGTNRDEDHAAENERRVASMTRDDRNWTQMEELTQYSESPSRGFLRQLVSANQKLTNDECRQSDLPGRFQIEPRLSCGEFNCIWLIRPSFETF
jgi:hypothetical protein